MPVVERIAEISSEIQDLIKEREKMNLKFEKSTQVFSFLDLLDSKPLLPYKEMREQVMKTCKIKDEKLF